MVFAKCASFYLQISNFIDTYGKKRRLTSTTLEEQSQKIAFCVQVNVFLAFPIIT
jgi:hypothetical protein